MPATRGTCCQHHTGALIDQDSEAICVELFRGRRRRRKEEKGETRRFRAALTFGLGSCTC